MNTNEEQGIIRITEAELFAMIGDSTLTSCFEAPMEVVRIINLARAGKYVDPNTGYKIELI